MNSRTKQHEEYADWVLVRTTSGGAYLRESEALRLGPLAVESRPIPASAMRAIPESWRRHWHWHLRIVSDPNRDWWHYGRCRLRNACAALQTLWHHLTHALPVGPLFASERYCLLCGRYYRMPAGVPTEEMCRPKYTLKT